MEEREQLGVRVRSAKPGEDLQGAAGELIRQIMLVMAPKDYEATSVPIPAALLGRLAPLLVDRSEAAPVFRARGVGRGLRNRAFRHGWLDAAAVEVGQPGPTPHELRHTAASLAVSSGARVKAVQRILAHASAAVTLDVYPDLFDDDLDAAAEALDRHIRRVDDSRTRASCTAVPGCFGPPAVTGTAAELWQVLPKRRHDWKKVKARSQAIAMIPGL